MQIRRRRRRKQKYFAFASFAPIWKVFNFIRRGFFSFGVVETVTGMSKSRFIACAGSNSQRELLAQDRVY
jgi:hypothetical protein